MQRHHLNNLTKSAQDARININIDELTPCLRDSETGKLVDTSFKTVDSIDAKALKQSGWSFDWSKPFAKNETVAQLTVKDDSKIQGLIAYKDMPENKAVYVDIVEGAPENNGRHGRYKGVGGHLFAIACRESVKKGYGGFVYFDVKTKLTDHYAKELGARPVSGGRMYIDESAARKLIKDYFKDE